MPAETVLEQCAGAFAVDRDDETTFDSDVFPKIVHLDQVAADEQCGTGRPAADPGTRRGDAPAGCAVTALRAGDVVPSGEL